MYHTFLHASNSGSRIIDMCIIHSCIIHTSGTKIMHVCIIHSCIIHASGTKIMDMCIIHLCIIHTSGTKILDMCIIYSCIIHTCTRVKDWGSLMYASYTHASGSRIINMHCEFMHHSSIINKCIMDQYVCIMDTCIMQKSILDACDMCTSNS